MDNQQNLNIDTAELKKQLAYYAKQKDDLTADVFRVEGIIMFLQNELKRLTEKNIDNSPNNN